MPAHTSGGSSGTLAVAKNVQPGEVHFADKRLADGKFLVGLAGKAGDDVRRNAHIRNPRARFVDQQAKLRLSSAPRHAPERRIAAALQRQMQMTAQPPVLPEIE